VENRWVWQLHLAKSYTVSNVYQFLTSENDGNLPIDAHKLWIKVVHLKVNIFVWRLFFNRIHTKFNLSKSECCKLMIKLVLEDVD